MTSIVIEGTWHNVSRNQTRTISSMKVSMTADITHKLCVYNLATSFNWWPMSQAATVILPIELRVKTLLLSSGSTLLLRIVTEESILPAYQFSMIIVWAYNWQEISPIHCSKMICIYYQLLKGSRVGITHNAAMMLLYGPWWSIQWWQEKRSLLC